MRFLLILADKLKKSLSEIMELSTLELEYWNEYLIWENEEARKTMRRNKGGKHTAKH